MSEDYQCGFFSIVFRCPLCGLPIVEGSCKGGCPVEFKSIPLIKLPDELAARDAWADEICVADKTDPYYPIDEQFVTLRIVGSWGEEQRAMGRINVSTIFKSSALDFVHGAVFDILTLYLYAPDCARKKAQQVVEKWRKVRVGRKKRRLNLAATENQYTYLMKAVKDWEINLSLLLDAFTAENIEMQLPGDFSEQETREVIEGYMNEKLG